MNRSLEDIIYDLIGFLRPHVEGICSVLDIGTGTSLPVHTIADVFTDIKFNTVDVTDLRRVKKLPFLIYDGKILPFGDREFDVSLLNETLHHCSDPEPVLSEARRVAEKVYVIEHFPRPGTRIIDLKESEKDALRSFEIDCPVYNPFTEDSLLSLFTSVGLEILERVEIPYYGTRKIKKFLFKLK
jgi:SAM-dependent methyltransferase